MSRIRITWIIVLLITSLAGIVAFQVYWLRSSIRIREERFDQHVNEALSQLSQKIQSKDVAQFLSDSIELTTKLTIGKNERERSFAGVPASPGSKPLAVAIKEEGTGIDCCDQLSQMELIMDSSSGEIEKGVEVFPLGDLGSIGRAIGRIRVPSIGSALDSIMVSLQDAEMDELVDSLDKILFVSNGIRVVINQDKYPVNPEKVKKQTREKRDQIKRTINQMVVEYSTLEKPLDQRLDSAWLDSVLRAGFKDKGLELPFEYAVVSGNNDSLLNLRSVDFKSDLRPLAYKTSLFPENVFVKPDYLLVYFPRKDEHILRSLAWVLAGSLLLIIVVMTALGGSVWALLRQKRLSDIKSDFINNMTHEFKTPIATISLAVDSITNSRVIQEPEQVRHFSRIIREENQRMNKQVENVLQMALLDRQVFNLQTNLLDVHEVIRDAVSRVELLVSSHSGTISQDLAAERSVAEADGQMLLTVLLNILDNAIKYSPDQLEIHISTLNRRDQLLISIADRGIGMSRDQQKRIFDKFYRVSTGNVHNVKGFGLGLSFARAIMLLHRGDIGVRSEPGRGSTFELCLPIINGNA